MATNINLSEVKTFSQFLPIVRKAESKLSLLGSRYVCIENENETLYLEELVSHMLALLKENPDFSEKDRGTVKELSKLINRLYKLSDEQVENSNLFTWLANLFGEIFGSIRRTLFRRILCKNPFYSDRYCWKDRELDNELPRCKLYKFYTPKQFENKFKYVPDKDNRDLDFYRYYSNIWYRPRKDPSARRVTWERDHDEYNMPAYIASTVEFNVSKKKSSIQ